MAQSSAFFFHGIPFFKMSRTVTVISTDREYWDFRNNGFIIDNIGDADVTLLIDGHSPWVLHAGRSFSELGNFNSINTGRIQFKFGAGANPRIQIMETLIDDKEFLGLCQKHIC